MNASVAQCRHLLSLTEPILAILDDSHRALEPLHGVGVALRDDLHAAIRKIAHPPRHAFALRGCLREIPEADALNPTADEISPCDAHGVQMKRVMIAFRCLNPA